MPVPSFLLRLHLIVVLAFVLFFALKAVLLLLGQQEMLRQLRARTRIMDSGLGLLVLLTGGLLLARFPGPAPTWLWAELALLLGLLPLAVAALRRQHKPAVAAALLALLYVGAVAYTGSLTLRAPAPPALLTAAGQPETTATPDADAPIEAAAPAGLSAADVATIAAAAAGTSEAAVAGSAPLAAGQALFQQNCVVCHGANGQRGLNGAHDLTKSNLNTAGRVYLVTNGLGKMPAFNKTLTDEQIEQVVAYSLTLR